MPSILPQAPIRLKNWESPEKISRGHLWRDLYAHGQSGRGSENWFKRCGGRGWKYSHGRSPLFSSLRSERGFHSLPKNERGDACRSRELEQVEEEGIKIHYLTQPIRVLSVDGIRASGVRCIRNRSGEPEKDVVEDPSTLKGLNSIWISISSSRRSASPGYLFPSRRDRPRNF